MCSQIALARQSQGSLRLWVGGTGSASQWALRRVYRAGRRRQKRKSRFLGLALGRNQKLTVRLHCVYLRTLCVTNLRARIAATPYDTVTSAVTEITYRPPTLPLTPNAFETLAPVPSEQEYIRSLAKRSAFDPAAPVEIYVHRELTNPHSRAKKQARWQAYMLYKRSLLDQMIKEEYANLMGRTRREARAEATWKWRNRLYQEQRARKKERWVARGGEARQARRKVRKAKKAERLQRKMRELVLAPAPNQIIPGQVAA